MTIPKLLLSRILNPDEPAPLACTAIAQIARNVEYSAESAFEVLLQAFIGDAREEVERAILAGAVEIAARAPHADTIARQIDTLRAFRGDRYARFLLYLLSSKKVPREARGSAAAALATHNETDLSGPVLIAIEERLQLILGDAREDTGVQRALRTSFGHPRAARPRIHSIAVSRGDETVAL